MTTSIEDILAAADIIAVHMNERLYNGRVNERPASIDQALRTIRTAKAIEARKGQDRNGLDGDSHESAARQGLPETANAKPIEQRNMGVV